MNYFFIFLYFFIDKRLFRGFYCFNKKLHTRSCHIYQSTVCYKNLAFFQIYIDVCLYILYTLFHFVYRVKNRLTAHAHRWPTSGGRESWRMICGQSKLIRPHLCTYICRLCSLYVGMLVLPFCCKFSFIVHG